MVDNRFFDRRAFAVDQVIFKEGDVGHYAYLVQSGTVRIYRGDVDVRANVLGEIGKGGLFGEMALIDDEPRMASAKAIEPTVLIQVNRAQFQEKLKGVDPFIRALLQILTIHVRDNSRGR